jgi:hypothetical protein
VPNSDKGTSSDDSVVMMMPIPTHLSDIAGLDLNAFWWRNGGTIAGRLNAYDVHYAGETVGEDM